MADKDERSRGNRSAGKCPLYMRVLQSLRADIVEGKCEVGSRLPSEKDLAVRFGVSRHTVREALRNLREDGFISARQGSGSTIATDRRPTAYVHSVRSIAELVDYVSDAPFFIEHSSVIVADATLARRLRCAPGRRWIRVTGIRYLEEKSAPLCATEIFVHSAYGPVRELRGRQSRPIYEYLEARFGERIAEVVQTLRGTSITIEMADRLNVALGYPAVEVERTYKTVRGKVVEIAFSVYPADRFSYSVTLRRENAG